MDTKCQVQRIEQHPKVDELHSLHFWYIRNKWTCIIQQHLFLSAPLMLSPHTIKSAVSSVAPHFITVSKTTSFNHSFYLINMHHCFYNYFSSFVYLHSPHASDQIRLNKYGSVYKKCITLSTKYFLNPPLLKREKKIKEKEINSSHLYACMHVVFKTSDTLL